MPLSKGDRLGPYEILALVGQGGMGEVYRAHDDRLRRDVAIKVSNAQFTERFAIEARSIASLNHTNICHLYDVGPNYLVMEYVEGEDLKGPLDFKDALPIIQQLIDGIEAAHEKNIVHRDLKPANIKITPEGVVKILDFGLAKAMDPNPPSGSNAANSPTLTIGATGVGTILGTASYMAPEQARGKTADKRSDIWSFGVILFELLTGQKMFPEESAVEILGAVLNKDPDIAAAPARVHKLLRWCLEKDRKMRLSSISDARRLLTESEPTAALAAPPVTDGRRWLWPTVAAIAVFGAAALGVGLWRATRPVERPLVRTNLDLPGYAGGGGGNLALSTDGTRIAYVTRGEDGKNRLATRLLAESEAKALAGTEGASNPFFSPDGQWIGFGADGQVKKVLALGGAPLKLADATVFLGGSWSENGFIVAAVNVGTSLVRIPESGGAAEALLPPGPETALAPQVLPSGEKVMYSGQDAQGPAVKILSLETKKVSTLIPGALFARYLPTGGAARGHIVYLNGSTLLAARFDPVAGEVRGQAVPVLDDVAGGFSFSAAGDVLYTIGAASDTSSWPLRWLRPDGKTETLLESRGSYTNPRVSPDGKLLALTLIGDSPAENRLLVYDWRNDRTLPLTEKGQVQGGAVWTPDSRYLIWAAPPAGGPAAGGKTRFLWKRADGSGEVHTLVESATYVGPTSISPDGKYLALMANGGARDEARSVGGATGSEQHG
jgi:serine/threonine-protein kinase